MIEEPNLSNQDSTIPIINTSQEQISSKDLQRDEMEIKDSTLNSPTSATVSFCNLTRTIEQVPKTKKAVKIVNGAIPNSSYASYISSIRLLPNKEKTKQIASLIRRTGKLDENQTIRKITPSSYSAFSEASTEDEIPFVVPTRHYDM